MIGYRKTAFAVYPSECSWCGSDEFLEVHHKDEDQKNNDIANLQILCRKCHAMAHSNPLEMPGDQIRVLRRTHPTAAFTLTVSLIAWIDQEAKRRGVSKSVVVREVLEAARVESESPVEQEVAVA